MSLTKRTKSKPRGPILRNCIPSHGLLCTAQLVFWFNVQLKPLLLVFCLLFAQIPRTFGPLSRNTYREKEGFGWPFHENLQVGLNVKVEIFLTDSDADFAL
ncbi:hypothetical protein Pfo_016495, partial [Paulownia fortunei]